MMPSLFGIVICLLFWTVAAQREELRCSVTGPVGALHPVQGLLERFETGPGCAARQQGNQETHVVAVGRGTNPDNKVTVLLKPLSPSSSPLRPIHLLLSSKLPVSWWLEAVGLLPGLPVQVQVFSNSSVQSHLLRLHIHSLSSVPFRPRALHRWAMKHHGNLSSMTHTAHGNRVYVRLGEDPTQPAMCQLQSVFLSHNYITSDLQPQEVQGCVDGPAAWTGPEVHVIKLHSAGSGLCGSVQVEVMVSLVPPRGNPKPHKVVLVLSSSVPVNWAISAHGVLGHISVHSSSSVSPPYPPEPNLTLSSTLVSDLSTVSDLLAWARGSVYAKVSSYTEADLANRFMIQLAGAGADGSTAVSPLVVRPPWTDEQHLRQWLKAGGRNRFKVQCEDGLLSVVLDRFSVQDLPDPVTGLSLRDPMCQAQFNGSHFLLVFPVISCGTEVLLLTQPRGVQYKNMVLLWRDKPQNIQSLNETEKSRPPLGIHFDCLASVPGPPGPPGPATDNITEPYSPQIGLVPWVPRVRGPDPELSHFPTLRHKPGPVILLKLFVTKHYEQKRVGPCVIPANQRIYIEIAAEGPLTDVVELTSCVVSPLSDPKKSPYWSVISEGCSSDASLTLQADPKEEETEGDNNREEEEEDDKGKDKSSRDGANATRREYEPGEGPAENRRRLRFSFILRSVYNNSMQFLHCSLRLCISDSPGPESTQKTASSGCQGGLRVPPLAARSPGRQCEIRNLSRPMVVTQSMASLLPKPLRPPAGPRTRRLSVAPLAVPQAEERGSELQTGAVMGVVLLSFVMGVGLMGGLWLIYNHTGGRQASLRGDEGYLTDQNPGDQNLWKPASVSDQSCSSV